MGVLWGHTISVALRDSTRDRELQDMLDDGANCVRINDDATIANLARSKGFPRHSCIVGGGIQTYPADVNAYAQKCVNWAKAYPEALIEPGNEQAIYWTAQQMATVQKAVYAAVKNAGLPNPVVMSSTIEGPTGPSNLHPVDWCYALASYGCTVGTGFDWANYHGYGDPASRESTWLWIWTPRNRSGSVNGATWSADGKSCQAAFGNPPFAMTEYGINLGAIGGNLTTQDTYVKGWMNLLLGQPKFVYGANYTMSADAPGSGTNPDYGLRDHLLNRRPAFSSYRLIAVATAQNPPSGGGTGGGGGTTSASARSNVVGPAALATTVSARSNVVGPAIGADSTAPTVSLTAPANGSTVSGNVTISATASDNAAVARVEFLVDGVLVDTDTTPS